MPQPDDAEFIEWIGDVDRAVRRWTGVSHSDIADQPWRDWFDDGLTAKEAAMDAIRSELG